MRSIASRQRSRCSIGGNAVADIGVAAEPERHTGDQSAAADAIEHRVFLGDADRRRGSGERGAKLHERDIIQALIARHLGENGAEQVRIAHEAVRVLVMLVGADAVEAELRRQHQFVDRPVVVVGDLVGVAVLPPGRIDPSRRQAPGEILRQIAIGHEMKHRDLHGPSSFLSNQNRCQTDCKLVPGWALYSGD